MQGGKEVFGGEWFCNSDQRNHKTKIRAGSIPRQVIERKRTTKKTPRCRRRMRGWSLGWCDDMQRT